MRTLFDGPSIQRAADAAFAHMIVIDGVLPLLALATSFTAGLLAVREKDANKRSGKSPAYGALAVLILSALVYPAFVIGVATTKSEALMARYVEIVLEWYSASVQKILPYSLGGFLAGVIVIALIKRYLLPWLSQLRRENLRKVQADDLSDIREEAKIDAIDFNPEQHFEHVRKDIKKNQGKIFLANDSQRSPIFVDAKVWYNTNKLVIGPTRYGKGVFLQQIFAQIIKRNGCVFYLDPKGDDNIPALLYKLAMEMGKKFRYLSFDDDEYGSWSPFKGGTFRDALVRVEIAFRLQFTGNPGTDYYKSQERKSLLEAFELKRDMTSLLAILKKEQEDLAKKAKEEGSRRDSSNETRIIAELKRWKEVKSFRPPSSGSGLSIEQALLDGDIVYVKGDLDDEVKTTALKIFGVEVVQEARRLAKQRKFHATVALDEASVLVSRETSRSLATALGYNLDHILLTQARADLENLTDQPGAGKIVANQIDQNSQIKIVYGGTNRENAEWVSRMSGDVLKRVRTMERTSSNSVGGEIWDDQRSYTQIKEPLIPVNRMLLLPPLVCAVIRPAEIAKVGFTAPVIVTSDQRAELENWLSKKLSNGKPLNSSKQQTNGGQSREENRDIKSKPTSSAETQPEHAGKKLGRGHSKKKRKPRNDEPSSTNSASKGLDNGRSSVLEDDFAEDVINHDDFLNEGDSIE